MNLSRFPLFFCFIPLEAFYLWCGRQCACAASLIYIMFVIPGPLLAPCDTNSEGRERASLSFNNKEIFGIIIQYVCSLQSH